MGELKKLYRNIRRLGEVLADVEESPSDEVLTVAKMMGVSQEDITKYGGDSLSSRQFNVHLNDSSQAVLTVAKMMGVSQEDIIKYGV